MVDLEQLWQMLQLSPEWSISKQEWQPTDGGYQQDQLNYMDDALNTAMDPALIGMMGGFDPNMLAPTIETVDEGSQEGRRMLQNLATMYPNSDRGMIAEAMLNGMDFETALKEIGIAPKPLLDANGKPVIDEKTGVAQMDSTEYENTRKWAEGAFTQLLSDRDPVTEEVDHPVVAWAKEHGLPDPREIYTKEMVGGQKLASARGLRQSTSDQFQGLARERNQLSAMLNRPQGQGPVKTGADLPDLTEGAPQTDGPQAGQGVPIPGWVGTGLEVGQAVGGAVQDGAGASARALLGNATSAASSIPSGFGNMLPDRNNPTAKSASSIDPDVLKQMLGRPRSTNAAPQSAAPGRQHGGARPQAKMDEARERLAANLAQYREASQRKQTAKWDHVKQNAQARAGADMLHSQGRNPMADEMRRRMSMVFGG